MLKINMLLTYPLLVILSIGKKSFEKMGKIIGKSGDTVTRLLPDLQTSFSLTREVAKKIFRKKNKLFFIIDDTLVKKISSQFIEGTGLFFDTKIGRRITAFRAIFGMLSDGKFAIPIDVDYLFSKEIEEVIENPQSKNQIAIALITLVKKLFPNTKIIVLADGLYANIEMLSWCKDNNIAAEMRMHSNRKVFYNGEKWKIKELAEQKGIRLKGRKMARTLTVTWHKILLELTIVRRFDKHRNETIVFQIATYNATPHEHVEHYKKRWVIEKFFRTVKQELGLEQCFSRKFQTQKNHAAAVCTAYTLAQLEMKKHKLKTPEEALRRLKRKKVPPLISRFAFLNQLFPGVHA